MRTARLPWLVVTVVGLAVVGLVIAWGLFSRLSAGQAVLDGVAPAFTEERVAGARAGVDIVSSITDLADPVTLPEGGAAAEVPQLVAFVSEQTGLTEPEVLAALQAGFPHTTALLQAIPLSAVTDEVSALIPFLSGTLGLPPDEVLTVIGENFPRLAQVITALPAVTDGWDDVPGTENLTRFNGEQVTTVPEVRDYFSEDVIPMLETQQQNLRNLATFGGVGYVPLVLTVVGLLVVVYGIAMTLLAGWGVFSRGVLIGAWVLVVFVGAFVVLLVFALQLFPRLNGGQELLDAAAPAFTEERVAGARAGVDIVSSITDLADPVVLPEGGAAAEVPELVAFVSEQTGLTEPAVLAALQAGFPHTTALLQAIPLSEVTNELPGLIDFLSQQLQLSPEQVQTAINDNFPRLAQTIAALPVVTNGWDGVPGTENLTRFNGEQVTTVPEVRDYLSEDVIPVLETQQQNLRNLATPFPPVDVFPPLLLAIGIIVILFGTLMLSLSLRVKDSAPYTPAPASNGSREEESTLAMRP